jgi:hypothetical protein
MWGFWDGAHWQSNAPIYNADWSLKPSGEAFIDQIYHQWWTNLHEQTPASGDLTLRGFKGKYRLRVACGTTMQEQDVVLDGDKTLTINLQCLSRTRDEIAAENFQVRFEGAQQQVKVQWEGIDNPTSILIFNALGQKVASTNHPAGNGYDFEVAHWPAGIYYVKGEVKGQTVTNKVLIHH